MLKKMMMLLLKFSLAIVSLVLIMTLLPRLITALYASTRIDSIESAPSKPVAIIFGAGLTREGRATRVLRDRVETAARLYFAGKVEKLLMSGDNSHVDYNEPQAMKDYALQLGVDASGVAAENHYFLKRSRAYWNLRELIATPVALWEVHISQPTPILGHPEPIFGDKTPINPNGSEL